MKKLKKLKISTTLISFLAVIFIISIFIFPSDVIDAAKYGISLWFNNLFPALFPFIVGSNILIDIGAVSFIGIILEPIMRPIFNISGKGAFPCIMGAVSGFPVGAKITGDLRYKNQIDLSDTARIMSLCNNPSPLFILGTVSIGMYKNPKIGFSIMLVIYLSAISTGLLFRFYGKNSVQSVQPIKKLNILKKAYRNQINNRINNYKSFGLILGDSIMNAMEIVTKVGGFVIFFSVISRILSLTPLIEIIENILTPLFSILKLDKSLYKGIILGIIEITNGIDIISKTNACLKQQLIVTACLLSWNGLSIHAQVISMISHTDIKIYPYIVAKLIQTMFTVIYSCILFYYI